MKDCYLNKNKICTKKLLYIWKKITKPWGYYLFFNFYIFYFIFFFSLDIDSTQEQEEIIRRSKKLEIKKNPELIFLNAQEKKMSEMLGK